MASLIIHQVIRFSHPFHDTNTIVKCFQKADQPPREIRGTETLGPISTSRRRLPVIQRPIELNSTSLFSRRIGNL